jgi:hypothetical protein
MGFLRGFLKEHDNTAHLFQYYKEGDTPSFPNLNLGAVPAAFLDAGGLINASFLPVSAMQFKGEWNASTNTPTLADGAGTDGDVYIVTTAGSRDLGSGTIDFYVNDWVMYNGAVWIKAANTNIFNDLEVKGELDWSGGNVVYVPLEKTGKTQTEILTEAITAATSGDTLQLAAGTYTITAELVGSKRLHYRGMGRGITKITTSTDLVSDAMINISPDGSGSLISDMDIEWTGEITGAGSQMIKVRGNLNVNNVHIYNLATSTNARYPAGFRFASATAYTLNVVNSFYTATGAKGWGALATISGYNGTMNFYNVHATSADGSSVNGANILYCDKTGGTINVYGGSYITATDKASAAVECNAGTINVYNGAVISGSGATAFDVKRNAGTITLYAGTNLVNNKTSGTITYAGTVASSQINLGGTSLNKTQLDALLALLEE